MLLFDPVALDPSGKTKIGAVVPNRDASRLAVGVYAQGSERKDFRIIDGTTGSQIGPVIRVSTASGGRVTSVCVHLAAYGGVRCEAGADALPEAPPGE